MTIYFRLPLKTLVKTQMSSFELFILWTLVIDLINTFEYLKSLKTLKLLEIS